jgi:hypothetical protein
MDTVSLAKYSMMRGSSILLQIGRLVEELKELPPSMPATEAAQLVAETAVSLEEVMLNIGGCALSNRLNDEAPDAKEDIALYGTRKSPRGK